MLSDGVKVVFKVTMAGWLPERCTLHAWVTGRGRSQESLGLATHFLAYDYAYEGAVRVASAMACHASDEARGIIRGASL